MVNIMSDCTSKIDFVIYETIMSCLILISWFVLFILLSTFKNIFYFKNMMHSSIIESAWTIIPLGILFIVGVPSLFFLFFEENLFLPFLTVKVLGNQWFWSYFYNDLDLQIDSFMKKFDELSLGDTYFLEASSFCVVPSGLPLEFLVSSSDVLHSWAIPSLGMKTDAIPGLSSSILAKFEYPGVHTGMCSELCGAFHSYMPISLEITPEMSFVTWVNFSL